MRTKHRRNRKKRVHGYAARVPLAAFVAVVLMLAIGVLWVKAGTEALGREIVRLEQVSADLTEQLLTEDMKWNRMRSARNIATVLRRRGIEMGWPSSDQVVRMQAMQGAALLAGQQPAWESQPRYADAGRKGRYE